jgi:hypothetical protein
MADSSSPSPSEPSSTLPRQFQIEFSSYEFAQVAEAAQRFADGCPPSIFHLCFEDESLVWKFSQANVSMAKSFMFSQADASLSGHVTLPVHFFTSMETARVSGESDEVVLAFDLDANTVTYVAKKVSISTTLPRQTDPPEIPTWTRTSRVFFHGPVLTHVGAFLVSNPVASDGVDDDVPGITPFITASFDGDTLTLSRDWSRHGGPVLSLAVEAGGDFRGSFSMFADVLARELYVEGGDAEGLVAIEFNEHEPHVCRIPFFQTTLAVNLGFEHVFEYRRTLEMSLQFSEAELVVERDPRIGWDPTVVVTAGSRTVLATLTPGQNGLGHYVRLSTDIASDIPWSSTLAAEVNAWNDRWPTVKLVHTDGILRAIADMPVSAMPAMAGAVVDLTEKAQVVDDLIAAVL